MTEERTQVQESTVAGDGTTTRSQVVSSHNSDTPYARAEQFVYLLLGILEGFLAIRFVLTLLGANHANAFAQLIYSVSAPFVAPFFGLFGYTFEYGIARFEIETLVAMAIYALVAWGITRLFRIGRTQ